MGGSQKGEIRLSVSLGPNERCEGRLLIDRYTAGGGIIPTLDPLPPSLAMGAGSVAIAPAGPKGSEDKIESFSRRAHLVHRVDLCARESVSCTE